MITYDEFYVELERKIARAGSSRQFAADVGVSPGWVYKVISGQTPPGPKLLQALGYREVKMLQKVRKPRWDSAKKAAKKRRR